MKTFLMTLLLSLAWVPMLVTAADDDVTIRIMEMDEISSDAVTQHIQLPEPANVQASEAEKAKNRQQIQQMNQLGEDELQQGDQEQIREMEQHREQLMEQQQEMQQVLDDIESQQGQNGNGPGGPN